ncbi:hypothetical protein [Streptomyces sp. NEAU-YJ-81]
MKGHSPAEAAAQAARCAAHAIGHQGAIVPRAGTVHTEPVRRVSA